MAIKEIRKTVDELLGWLAEQGFVGDEDIKEVYAQGERFAKVVSEGAKRAKRLSEKVLSAMAASFPSVDLETAVEASALPPRKMFKRKDMLEHQFFPFKLADCAVHIAVINESGFLFLVQKSNELGKTFKYFSAPLKDIIAAIKKYYPAS